MKTLTAFLLLIAAPACAGWQKVYEGYEVDRFVQDGGALWALPGLTSSTDTGRTWVESDSQEGSSDVDIADGQVVSLDRHGYIALDDEEALPQDLWLGRIRFLDGGLLGIGEPREDGSGDSTVYLSTDGGRFWGKAIDRDVPPGSPLFTSDRKMVWLAVAGPDAVSVWRSVDGGRGWEPLGRAGGAAEALFFLDRKRGWLAARSSSTGTILYGTQDGGRNWERLAEIASSSGALQAIHFANAKRGWTAAPGELWRTEDGGRTWVAESPPTTAGVPMTVGLHYVEEKKHRGLLYGVTMESEATEDDPSPPATGAIYRLELKRE